MTRIGTRLLARGLISKTQLRDALRRQQAVGGYLGQHLLEAGVLSRTDLYDTLAEQWDLETRDLVLQPPDPRFATVRGLDDTFQLGWVPCEVTEDGVVVVATTVRPDAGLVEEVHDRFPGASVQFVACTQRDLDHVAARARRERQAPDAVADHRGSARRSLDHDSVAILVVAAAGFASVLVVASSTVLVNILALVAALFLGSVTAQCLTALRVGQREKEEVVPLPGPPVGDGSADTLLPVYTVLVPVSGGRGAVGQVVRSLIALDYPGSRLDALLLVGEDDEQTLAAVRSTQPPPWVRVVVVSPERFADPVMACDDGLALASGRYVVAYGVDEVPDPDQLRRAVAAFEADLEENLELRPGRAPLAGLRVDRRVWGRPASLASARAALDTALLLHRAFPARDAGHDLRRQLTSTHFNTSVLRQLGGWVEAVRPRPATVDPLRMSVLRSTSRSASRPRTARWLSGRADEIIQSLEVAGTRARAYATGRRLSGVRPTLGQTVLGFGMPVLFLVYPLLAAVVVTVAARVDLSGAGLESRLALAGVVATKLALVLAVVVTGGLAVRRGGWRVGLHAIALPLHWLLHAAAAWRAVVVLASRGRGQTQTGAGRVPPASGAGARDPS